MNWHNYLVSALKPMYAAIFLSQLESVRFLLIGVVGSGDGNAIVVVIVDIGSQRVAKNAFGRCIDSIKYSQAL